MKTRLAKEMTVLVLIFLNIILLSSCYSNIDLTEMAIATAIGFDKTENDHIKLTVQIVKPGVIKARDQGSEEKSVWVYSTTGETAFSAVRNLLSTVNRKTFYSHLQLIVISEELAQGGVLDVLDFLERDKEINRTSHVIVTEGLSAEEVINAQSELENIPAMHIMAIIENYTALAKIRKITFLDLIKVFNYPGFAATTAVVKKNIPSSEQEIPSSNQNKQDQNRELEIKDLKVEGTAVFKHDQLIGFLGPFQTRGLLFALNEVESGIINVQNPLHRDKKVAFEIVSSSTELNFEGNDRHAKLVIKVKAEGRLADQQGAGDLTTLDMIEEMNKLVAGVIKNNIQLAVDMAQKEYHLDYFGFAQIIHKNHLSYWKRVKDDWSNVFSQLPIEIEVSWNTSSSSFIRSPSVAR